MKILFEAEDGVRFESIEECLAHSENQFITTIFVDEKNKVIYDLDDYVEEKKRIFLEKNIIYLDDDFEKVKGIDEATYVFTDSERSNDVISDYYGIDIEDTGWHFYDENLEGFVSIEKRYLKKEKELKRLGSTVVKLKMVER